MAGAGVVAEAAAARRALDLLVPAAQRVPASLPEITRGLHGVVMALLAAQACGAAVAAGSWSDLLRSIDAFLDALGARAPWLAELAVAEDGANQLAAGVFRGAIDAEAIGSAYEGLLDVDLVRLAAPSQCIGPARWWLSARELESLPAPERLRTLRKDVGLGRKAAERIAALEGEEVLTAGLQRYRADGTAPLAEGALVLQPSLRRRASGSHYTPRAVTDLVVERTLGPLLAGSDVLGLRVCDPAMGSGAFLLAACRFLAAELVRRWEASGEAKRLAGEGDVVVRARRLVAERCLVGVDLDPMAAAIARIGLWVLSGQPGTPAGFLADRLRCGDALVGLEPDEVRRFDWRPGGEATVAADGQNAALLIGAFFAAADDAGRERERRRRLELARAGADAPVNALPTVPFHWRLEIDMGAGLDAVIGNPPWVAYAGRAAQPLHDGLRAWYARSPAFGGYRTLHGLFVHRAATLLRPGGRLGLVVPTSLADLEGYAPARAAHDALCDVDDPLADLGDVFEGVFQPCMALSSTRKHAPEASPARTWPLERRDLDETGARLLARIGALPKLPPSLFGERGYQTLAADGPHIRALAAPAPPWTLPIREGADIAEMVRRPPRLFADPARLHGRLRADWSEARVLIRQTARYPIAALADGIAFRNSILAGFSTPEWPAPALAAYLNAAVVRWFHFHAHRDARQGMPQLKIAHLRALPDLPDARVRDRLGSLGETLATRNEGIPAEARAALDDLVERALGLPAAERAAVRAWMSSNAPPRARRLR
jgi:Eco57I restriction-modification methylase